MKHKLEVYEQKRRFDETPEPRGRTARRSARPREGEGSFVIQRHDARRLHYDFRLELDGTLKSWAIPKGPSLDPTVKRLAVHVEDHPLEYGSFEGRIPEGSYGAGTVAIWDHGVWRPEGGLRGAREGYAQGKLKFTLEGERLHGGWTLVRSPMHDGKQESWLLIKQRDDEAVPEDEFHVVSDERAASKASKVSKASKKRALASDEAEVAGVRITHPDRVIDAQSGLRKIDLVEYFEAISAWLLPHVQGRPVALARAPKGVGGELFFQKHAKALQIPHATQHAGLDPGHAPLLTLDSTEALVGAAQMDTIELHTWNALAASIEKPDRIVFDLDPDPSLPWERMLEAAQLTRELLDALGLRAWCKTSGGRGLHVVVPLTRHAGWDEAKDFARAVASHMAATLPERFSAKMGAQNRKGRIFVDYLRNNRGASTAAAYAPRARPGLGVSVPVDWDELHTLTSGDQWNVANVRERLEALRTDPWSGYEKARQRITAAMWKQLGGK